MKIPKAKQGYKIVKTIFQTYEEIPDDWELEKISNLSKVFTGGTPATSNKEYWENGNIPWINSGEVQNCEVSNPSKLITEAGSASKNLQTLPKNTVVVALTGKPTCGNIGILTFETSTNQSVTGILPSQKFIPKFLLYMLIFRRHHILRLQLQTAQGHLNQQIVKDLLIPIPPIPQQQEIGSILSTIDVTIQKTNQVIEQTQHLRKGMIQQLITKGIDHSKFKKVDWYFGKKITIPEEWELKEIGDILNASSGGTPITKKPEFYNGNIPWVTSTDLNRGRISHTTEKITPEAVEETRLKIYPKGTFVIATYGLEAEETRGKCGLLDIDAAINQACLAFEKSNKINAEFLFYFYLNYAERIISIFAQGTRQQNLYDYTIKEAKIFVPPMEEQKQIVTILSNINTQIQKEKIYVSNLEKLKKGLMQKLLTGQIRVKV